MPHFDFAFSHADTFPESLTYSGLSLEITGKSRSMFIETCLILLVPAPACAAGRTLIVKLAGLVGSAVHYKTGMGGFFHSCHIPHIGSNGNSIIILKLVNCSIC